MEARLGTSTHLPQVCLASLTGASIECNLISNLLDEPPSQRPCIRISLHHDSSTQTMVISTLTIDEGSNSSSLHPFDFNGTYESESDEAAFLTRDMAQWSSVSDKVPTKWHADLRWGIEQAQKNIWMVRDIFSILAEHRVLLFLLLFPGIVWDANVLSEAKRQTRTS